MDLNKESLKQVEHALRLCRSGQYTEASERLDHAASVLDAAEDKEVLMARVNEARARVLMAKGRYKEAGRVLSEAISILEERGDLALLAGALTLQGVVWARLRDYERSIHVLRRAMSVAAEAGARAEAGTGALTLIEEHGETRLAESELRSMYLSADEILEDTRDDEEAKRLRACARTVIKRLFVFVARPGDEGFSLPNTLLAYEARFIEEALEMEEGVVARAAGRLGVTRQTLTHMLETRHRNLLHKRRPAKPRRSRKH